MPYKILETTLGWLKLNAIFLDVNIRYTNLHGYLEIYRVKLNTLEMKASSLTKHIQSSKYIYYFIENHLSN